MFSLINNIICQLQNLNLLSFGLERLVYQPQNSRYHLIILNNIPKPVPSFINESFLSILSIVNLEHLPFLTSCNDRVPTVTQIVSCHAFESSTGMSCTDSCHRVELTLEIKNWDKMSAIKPNHIIYHSIKRTQFVLFKLVIACYRIVDIAFELLITLQTMYRPILCENRLDQRFQILSGYFVFSLEVSQVLGKLLSKRYSLYFGSIVNVGRQTIGEFVRQLLVFQ